MAYATPDQIALAAGSTATAGNGSDRYVSLFDWDGDGVADAGVVAEAQTRADGWIDGYLRGGYLRDQTPIANPSDALIRLSADECVYWAKSSKGLLANDGLDTERRKEREALLKDMAAGRVKVDAGAAPKSAPASSHVVPLGGCITRDGLKGMW